MPLSFESSAGILPALLELKEVAGWKPALRKPSKGFFSIPLEQIVRIDRERQR